MSMLPQYVIDVLRKRFPGLIAIYLFGSRAKGRAHEGSDWDIGLLGREAYGFKQLLQASTELAVSLSTEHVDLIDLFCANTVLAYQIISEGECVWSDDTIAVANYEIKSFGLYVDLNIERAEILESVRKRGSVF